MIEQIMKVVSMQVHHTSTEGQVRSKTENLTPVASLVSNHHQRARAGLVVII